MNIDQFIVSRELTRKLELEPFELSNIEDNLLKKLLKNVQGTCINHDNGYIYRIHDIIKRSNGKRRNEDLNGRWQFTVLYSADTIMLRKGEPLYGLRVDIVDKLGVHCSYNDMIIMFIDAENLEHNYIDTIRKGSIIDVVVLKYIYIPFSKRINCLGSSIQYYTVHPIITNTVTLVPSSDTKSDTKSDTVIQQLHSIPNTIDSVYYKLTDPFWMLSITANMELLIKEAVSQLPLKRYAKVNNTKMYNINGLEMAEPTERTLTVYSTVPQNIDTKNDNIVIVSIETVIAECDRINSLCSSGFTTVYSPYIKNGEWDVSNVLSKSYLIILIQSVDIDTVQNVSVNSVVNDIIKKIGIQLYTINLLSERYGNVNDSPDFVEYFNCQTGITQSHREHLDTIKY